MAKDEQMEMDHEAVRTIGLDVSNLAVSLQGVQRYATGDSLKAGDFGGTPQGYNAFQSLNGAIQRLSGSVHKAEQFLSQAAQRITDSAKATENTDVDNAWGITASGEGK